MVQSAAHHHRPTLKQQNKPFKSKHASKSSLKEIAKGRIPKSAAPSVKPKNAAQSKHNRKNTSKQTLATKTSIQKTYLKLFNGVNGVPRIVSVIPLSADVSPEAIVKTVAESLDHPYTSGRAIIPAARFKTSLQFIPLTYGDLYSTMDAAKVADYVVFVLSPTVEVDKWGDTLLRILQSQGMPEVVTVVSGTGVDKGVMKSLLSFIQYFVPTQSRVYDVSSSSDTLNAIRALAEGRPKDVRWRDGRSYMLAEDLEWSEEDEGTLKVTGIIRGNPLCADHLVHIPNFADYQISKIYSSPLIRASSHKPTAMDIDESGSTKILLAEPNASSADSLVSRNAPDDTHNEQTWPTEEEMASAPIHSFDPEDLHSEPEPKRKRIPKGMSEYQAGWIPDDENTSDEEYFDATDEDQDQGDEEEMEEPAEMMEIEDDDMDVESRKNSVRFEDLPDDEEEHQLASWLTRSRQTEEQEALSFPDEIDTPKDIAARVRFQRYRGLRSFRTSPWDPYENLPLDYSTIFQFEDFKRTERGLLHPKQIEVGSVDEGVRVEVWLKGVPREANISSNGGVFVLFALLKHEHKASVLNFTVQRNTEYTGSVRSKDPLIMCVGPRRLKVNPIYSQHTRGGGKGANNVHKFERFFKSNGSSVATLYGPINFGRLPCLLLREDPSKPFAPELVATGTFTDVDTTRVVAKRIILSGHPFKVHKKTATVRYMFFNQEDVAYFKPIQLHTKHGRTGHIRESLGTHGYLKAHFDGPVSQMDTVCMSLYKRIYPKWATTWRSPALRTLSSGQIEDKMQE